MEVAKKTEKRIRRIIMIVGAIVVFFLLTMYVTISLLFTNRFYFGSYINGISVAGKTVDQVEELMEDGSEFNLVLKERKDQKEFISGKDISYVYQIGDEIKEAKSSQSPFLWIVGLFKTSNLTIDFRATYDDVALKEIFKNLKCIQVDMVEEPQSASMEYKNGKYIIMDEVEGNKIIPEKLYEEILKALGNMQNTIDVEKLGCYENPKYISTSKEVIEAEKLINKYVSSEITYIRGDKKVDIIDGEDINKWVSIDENFQVALDDVKITEYILNLDDNYDTVGKARQFVTTGGDSINIAGGDYGWTMDNESEIEELKHLINEGSVVSREPKYLQQGLTYNSDDIGNTYVEIDITNQYLWFYVNGGLIVEGPIVSGNANTKYATPTGVYNLDYKQENAVLRGPGYESPVSYWMPFNGDIGIHDATWRSAFGGQIYKGDGSHGCINASYSLAKGIFENISVGTPVICYQ